ncbi:MAG: discoidin domain-containing protein [Cytophagales bacterium]|nr:discoidin domain-containing protein [Cytophagales bacterium]
MITTDMVTSVRNGTLSRKTPWTENELYKAIPQPLTNKAKWKITSSHNQAGTRYIADGKMQPRWASEAHMQAGMWVTVELPNITNINAVNIDAADSKADHPKGYEFFVSNDGKTWRQITKGTGKKPLVEIQFPAVKAKFIKIQLTEKSNSYYWSIHEMEIFEKRQ